MKNTINYDFLGSDYVSLTANIYYSGKNGNAKKFVEEMISSGTVEKIRNEEGNEKYEYFFPVDDSETVLLIDRWKNKEALDIHHKSEMMKKVAELREKYNLSIKIEQYEKIVK